MITKADKRKNIFSFYYENEKKYRFFIFENTWKNSIGEVLFFKGVDEGKNLKGNAPYFNNPIVYCKLWFVKTSNEIKDNTRFKIIKIYDGSTYRYSLEKEKPLV